MQQPSAPSCKTRVSWYTAPRRMAPVHAQWVILFTFHQGRVSWTQLISLQPTCKHHPQQDRVEMPCLLEKMMVDLHNYAQHASVVTILLSVQISYGARPIPLQLVYVHVLLAQLSITEERYLAQATRSIKNIINGQVGWQHLSPHLVPPQ